MCKDADVQAEAKPQDGKDRVLPGAGESDRTGDSVGEDAGGGMPRPERAEGLGRAPSVINVERLSVLQADGPLHPDPPEPEQRWKCTRRHWGKGGSSDSL